MPTLDDDQIKALQKQIHSLWIVDETHLRRKINFKDFRSAFAFAGRIAAIAEEQGHHPDLCVGWGYVSVSLTTHAAKGLTENDFIMAAKLDDLTV